MSDKPVILVVDDEPQILRVLRASLPARGYQVRTAPGGDEALDEVRKEMPDLIILDLAMPGTSGLEVCRRVREFSAVPIIVLSAKGSEVDKVSALDLGADDYVTKPFGMDELLARVRAVLRRYPASDTDSSILKVGDLSLDIPERRVVAAGAEVKLTPKEFEILKYLMSNIGKVVTHRALLQAVWGSESTEQTEYLRVFINQLRRKIEPDPQHPRYIVTEPWVGYRLAPDD
ncbi:MAG TPA: response regulator transcription factor [Blastocatellia bacterium]|jgi:two-component system KDP operon response regulator KdpE|nr:response regulator transcription factor [Blastocatellia bacterium]